MSDVEQAVEPIILAEFDRRDHRTGAMERLRLEQTEFQGRTLLQLWSCYRIRAKAPGDDGWRRQKGGLRLTVREHELDGWIRALEQARQTVAGLGRSTDGRRIEARPGPVAPKGGHRTPTPVPIPEPVGKLSAHTSRDVPPWEKEEFDEFK